MTSPLYEVISQQARRQAASSVMALVRVLRRRFGTHALAVLYYGSCRRRDDDRDGIVDLYLLVDEYRAAYRRWLPAFANRMLAPNVYYLEIPFSGRTVRAKYAVESIRQFESDTAHSFHSYLWGRFAQPCGLLYATDEIVARRVVLALCGAVATFAKQVLPELPPEFDAETLWTQGLLLTYGAELRSERPERVRSLYRVSANDLDDRTRAAAAQYGWKLTQAGRYRNPSTRLERLLGTFTWSARRVQGKALSLLRLLKASFTFDGGIAYIAWKIERHSGVRMEITPFMRSFPRLGAIGAFWRIWRLGGFR